MNTSRKFTASVAGLAAGAAAAGMLLLGAGAAHAAAPPYEPDPTSVGTITFYDANGNVITSGPSDDNDTPFAAYAVGSAYPHAGDKQAALLFANPDPNSTPPNWYKKQVGVYTQLPLTSGPTNIQALSATNPVVAGANGDLSPDYFEGVSKISTQAGYQNVIQVRLRTATPAGQPAVPYDVADISVNSTTHTWTQLYPVPKTATTTTLTASPNPATSGSAVTLTANETPAVAGTVQFQDGSTNIGTAVAVDSTGKATTTTSTLSVGSHSLTAVFTPTDTTANVGSTSASVTEVIQAPATPTTTSLSVNQDGTAGDPATLTATVTGPGTTANSSGSVSFYDNGSSTALNSAPVTSSNGTYTLSLPTGFAAGSHSIVAKFTPTDPTQFNSSQSAAQAFTTQPAAVGDCATQGSSCTDPQNVTVTVPSGTLVITTPYTASAPLNLGTMALAANDSEFIATGSFNNIQVTDLRAGGKGYTVSALSTPLSDGKTNPGSTINAENVGLTKLTATPGTGFAGTVTSTDNPAADPAVAPGDPGSKGLGGTTAHTVFTVDKGSGSVTVNGTLTITAPTSTEAGIFTGTITFTVG